MELTDAQKLALELQSTNMREARLQPIETMKEHSRNACTFEDTIAASGVSSFLSTDPNTKINGNIHDI